MLEKHFLFTSAYSFMSSVTRKHTWNRKYIGSFVISYPIQTFAENTNTIEDAKGAKREEKYAQS